MKNIMIAVNIIVTAIFMSAFLIFIMNHYETEADLMSEVLLSLIGMAISICNIIGLLEK